MRRRENRLRKLLCSGENCSTHNTLKPSLSKLIISYTYRSYSSLGLLKSLFENLIAPFLGSLCVCPSAAAPLLLCSLLCAVGCGLWSLLSAVWLCVVVVRSYSRSTGASSSQQPT